MTRRTTRETGQAAPIYVTMVTGLLFLALAFFAVGQAGATRNGAQSGADAAALAVAQESRDQFGIELLANFFTPGYLDDIFNGSPSGPFVGCQEARLLAEKNDVRLSQRGCDRAGGGRWGFTVEVETLEPMGESILPGTEDKRARATATAVVVPRCEFRPAVEDDDGGEDSEPEEGEEEEPSLPGELVCDGNPLDLDPENLVLPDMSVLFSVRLAED
ncbi:pilus assembly protein TadG-related protein [Streptomyces sp. NPDC006645]|uniref:pilus assembly protein TadG-related protein n=1 Tax=unclassified Streptomyces TaxID=2593676 RepID=UPI0033AB955F